MYTEVNSWVKVCKKNGEDPKTLPEVSHLLEEDRKDAIAYFKAKKIAKAYNKVDEENGDKSTPWYLPYFNKSGGGFSFWLSDFGYWYADSVTSAAARLLFRTRAASDSAAKSHVKVYKDLVL